MRRLLLILLVAAPLSAENVRYQVRPVYSNVGFSIVKWGVLKEEAQFRDFNGTLDYDPSRPQEARINVVAQSASLDTKNECRDKVVKSGDFLDADRYPTLEFHSTGVDGNSLFGNLTIHGVTKPVRFAVVSHGVRDLPRIGKLA